MIRVGLVGGTGYTGVELLRLLLGHPEVVLTVVTSRADAGRLVSHCYPNLWGGSDLRFVEPDPEAFKACDVVFFATPNGTAMRMAPILLAQGIRVIDLAADFRLRDPAVFAEWYGEAHGCPEWLGEAVYGLPELNRSALRSARLVACAGCYPTAVQLGFAPLLRAGLIDPDALIADVKSGVSGAGRKAEVPLLMSESGESFKAYAVEGHRHWPEITQQLGVLLGRAPRLTFVPHLLPMIRGIHATLYGRLTAPEADLQALFESSYQDEPFVDVLPPGLIPETRNVRGSNRCQLAVCRPQKGDVCVVLTVIDNLVKGAAGQAIQCLNLMFELEETQGLPLYGLYP